MTTMTTIRKHTEFGYDVIAKFMRTELANGSIDCTLETVEVWKDGHITFPPRSFERFATREVGNNVYKLMIQDGFKFVSKETFEG